MLEKNPRHENGNTHKAHFRMTFSDKDFGLTQRDNLLNRCMFYSGWQRHSLVDISPLRRVASVTAETSCLLLSFSGRNDTLASLLTSRTQLQMETSVQSQYDNKCHWIITQSAFSLHDRRHRGKAASILGTAQLWDEVALPCELKCQTSWQAESPNRVHLQQVTPGSPSVFGSRLIIPSTIWNLAP